MEFNFIWLSSLINQPSLFQNLAQKAYLLTDSCQNYPNYDKWYWGKEIPRIVNGTGEIILCLNRNQIVGIAFLKKDLLEKKLCTFYVVENCRKKYISVKLLNLAFNYLGTTTPLISISEHKLPMFRHIIFKYNWELTQILSDSYYGNSFREFVYNGKLI